MCSYGRGKKSVGLREMTAAIGDTASLRIGLQPVVLASLALFALGLLVAQLARTV
jgi:hypothetical protein